MGRLGLCSLLALSLLAGTGRIGAQAAPSDAPPPSTLALDVPLSFWTGPSHPSGLAIGETNGISWGDYDGDGFPDLFACESGNLWHNLGGTDWVLAQNVLSLMPPATIRYGASFGDYDNDGLPDLGIEPRKVLTGDTCFHLLRNLGGSAPYIDVTATALLSSICLSNSETIGWIDTDGDGNLDMFLPAYPSWSPLPSNGNAFLHNLGPVGFGGAYLLDEQAAAVGLGNVPPDSARPEGSQFCDVDQDGDPDLYAGGFVYRNRSTPGDPAYEALPTASSGIGLTTEMDEGAMFFDYDMDGDDDLFVAYEESFVGLRLYENKGDGTFFEAESAIVDGPMLGAGLGMSAEDWDNDGDIDFTTRQVFRRNQLVETGQRHFTLALHGIPNGFISSATPAWADWDLDGDIDCAIGNYLGNGSFWFNSLYGPATPAGQRRSVRVRVVRDSDSVPGGLQTEYGAAVEVTVQGDASGLRRRKFVASGHGYLNQNGYDLTFGLPADPAPGNPDEDLLLDVAVTFTGYAGGGVRRIDRWVNPALGDIELADLADREIVVYRSGRVVANGVSTAAKPFHSAVLSAVNGGLALPSASTPLTLPVNAPTADRFVGIAMDTLGAEHVLQVREIELDGQLDGTVNCSGPAFNIALWDVTSRLSPQRVSGGVLAASTSLRNDRIHIPVNLLLQPGRLYKLVARVAALRSTTVQGVESLDGLTVTGGLNFMDGDPCSGAAVVAAAPQPTKAWMSVRFGPVLTTLWESLGAGLAGTTGVPLLTGAGELYPGEPISLVLSNARPLANAYLIVGFTTIFGPLKGGVLVPAPALIIGAVPVDGAGQFTLSAPMPVALPPEFPLYFQYWIRDPAGPSGYAASNGLSGTPQY